LKKSNIEFHHFPEKLLALPKRAAGAALKKAGNNCACDINFVMVPDAAIKKLNRKYRAVNRITDVISFRLSQKPLCGDIYISKGRSAKQAKTAGNTWEEELAYLVIHGMLHLFDYTDYKPAQRAKMFRVQDGIFKRILA